MINPAIETNLCGEMVEIYDVHWTREPTLKRHELVKVRGRVCAVTTGRDGGLKVWIEILSDDPGYVSDAPPGVSDAPPGDVLMWDIDGSMAGDRLRIVTKRQEVR